MDINFKSNEYFDKLLKDIEKKPGEFITEKLGDIQIDNKKSIDELYEEVKENVGASPSR